MNTNPVNLAVRFCLELVILIVSALWGWHLKVAWLRYTCTVCLPAIAATLWGIFRIPNDPKPAPVAIPGMLRLLLEWGLFGWAIWAMNDLGYHQLCWLMAVIVVIHYLVSYDRTLAMLKNQPYLGFVDKKK